MNWEFQLGIVMWELINVKYEYLLARWAITNLQDLVTLLGKPNNKKFFIEVRVSSMSVFLITKNIFL